MHLRLKVITQEVAYSNSSPSRLQSTYLLQGPGARSQGTRVPELDSNVPPPPLILHVGHARTGVRLVRANLPSPLVLHAEITLRPFPGDRGLNLDSLRAALPFFQRRRKIHCRALQMASLQLSSRVAASLLPVYQPGLKSVSCGLKMSQVCAGAIREDGNSSGEPTVTLSVRENKRTRFSGRNRFQEQSKCRTSLLKTEAPLDTAVPSSRLTGLGEASLQWSFETDASVGRVECNSRGCRPVYDEDQTAVKGRGEEQEDEFSSIETRAAVYSARSLTRDMEIRPYINFPLDFAEFLNEVWLEKSYASKYFELALKKNPNDGKTLLQYAEFAWKTLGDLDKADELFTRALEELPHDSDALALHSLFLWQSDEE
ncbi:hypothetical protein R1sor_017744 [Riccia sorocarpa]|uniref:Uncharacterized protein n=1 Tax=Riccia sorocarpa TaxID=122646 RepID=A0ABD3I7U1_9MARC